MSHPTSYALNPNDGSVTVTVREFTPRKRRGRTDLNRRSNEWYEYLHKLAQDHMQTVEPGGHWKGPTFAIVDENIADDMAEAMDFVGALVDGESKVEGGKVRLYSEGYWAHGF